MKQAFGPTVCDAPARRWWAKAAAPGAVGVVIAAETWIASRLLESPTAYAELLPVHAGVALAIALCAAVLHRLGERDPLILLFAVSVVFLGPVGVGGAAVTALFRLLFARRATPFLEWHASLFPDEEQDEARALHQSIVLRGHGPGRRSTVAPFMDVVMLGTLQEKQTAIALMAERFQPAFAEALRAALNDPEPVVRVQAAAAVARVENRFLQRAIALEERLAERPDDPDLLLALARHYDEHAATGLLDEGRARESVERALAFYMRHAELCPHATSPVELGEVAGRLLLRLGRAADAVRILEPLSTGASGAPPSGALCHYLECLYRLRRFAELREICRRIVQNPKEPPLPDTVREAAWLWAKGMLRAEGAFA